MKMLQRGIRGFLLLMISGSLLGVAAASHAQAVTTTPAAPNAYEPFVLTFLACGIDKPVDVYVFADSLLVKANEADGFLCGAVEKTASIEGLPSGTYSVGLSEYLTPGGDYLEDSTPRALGSVTVAPAPATVRVFAFYNLSIGHYFITAGTAEKDSLVSSGAGGWSMVDAGFRAWPAAGPAPTAAKPVCRFYSAAVNSHFYTAGPNECELLKQPGSGWTYEGIAFRALVPTKGSCYPGTTPVWRLYNDRFAQSDSNHRFVTSADTYRHMIANGWVGEGVAFCSPPA